MHFLLEVKFGCSLGLTMRQMSDETTAYEENQRHVRLNLPHNILSLALYNKSFVIEQCILIMVAQIYLKWIAFKNNT